MEVRTPDAQVGVIIGRFQVPDLHEGHCDLIETVKAKHKKVLVMICSTPGVLVTRKNPLDYFTRMLMIQEQYPDIAITPMFDMQSDDDWSKTVDAKITETFGDHMSVVLYGSRDSFIPHYNGKFPTVELADSINVTGTAIRDAASQEVRQHSEFRRGVMYAAHNKHPATFPTVDIAVVNYNLPGVTGHITKAPPKGIALGRKKTDLPGQWRFPGGFVDPNKDVTLEAAARRELKEEFGINLNVDGMRYLGSYNVGDWRYRNELDQIVTALFITRSLWGPLTPGDDMDEAKWFSLHDFNIETLVEGHRPLMQMVLTHLNKE